MTLFDTTIALAGNLPDTVDIDDVCKAAGRTHRWWLMVLSGHIKNPGIHGIQALHDTLLEYGARLNGSRTHS